jgi:anti-anti-sigma factor
MPNATGDPESGPSMRASTRLATNGTGRHPPAAKAGTGPLTAVAAHLLLNDLSMVLLAAAALDESWDVLSPTERRRIAARVHSHMTEVAERVKDMVRQPPSSHPGVIGTRRGPAQVRVRVQGPVDGVTGGYLRERVVEAGVERGRKEVLLDLYAVTSIDAQGLAAVLQIHRELATAGVCLAVIDASDQVRRSLESSGLAVSAEVTAVTLDLRSKADGLPELPQRRTAPSHRRVDATDPTRA